MHLKELFKKNIPFIILFLLAVFVILLNHYEYAVRSKKLRASAESDKAVIVKQDMSLSGHSSIAVDESVNSVSDGFIRFAALGTWDYSPLGEDPCPEALKRLDGELLSCTGFMYPLEAGQSIRSFCLLKSTQTCCYGPRPQWNQFILVEMKDKVAFERLSPVTVKGVFRIDPKPQEGFIYRMEGISVVKSIGGDSGSTEIRYDSGPFLSLWIESLILGSLLWFFFRTKSRKKENSK